MKKVTIMLLLIIPLIIVGVTLAASDVISHSVALSVSHLVFYFNDERVDEGQVLSVKADDIGKVRAEVYPTKAANKTVRYYVSEDKRAQIDDSPYKSGVNVDLRFIRGGEIVVSAVSDDGGVNTSAMFYIAQDKADEIDFGIESSQKTDGEYKLTGGESYVTECTVLPLSAVYDTIDYESSAPDIASVSPNGVVTALKNGVAEISAFVSRDGNVEMQKFAVRVSGQKTFTRSQVTAAEKEIDLKAYLTDSLQAEQLKVTQGDAVLNEGILSFKNDTTATVSANGESLQIVFDADNNKLEIKDLQNLPQNIFIGKSIVKLQAECAAAGKKAALSWRSSNSNVAILTEDGYVKALSEGEVTFTATASGMEAAFVTFNVTQGIYSLNLNYNETTDKNSGIKRERVFGSYIISNGNYTENGVKMSVAAVYPTVSAVEDRIVWTSSDASVAQVDANGNVVFVPSDSRELRTVTITASPALQVSKGHPVSAQYTFKVNDGVEVFDTAQLERATNDALSTRRTVVLGANIRLSGNVGRSPYITLGTDLRGNGYLVDGTDVIPQADNDNFMLFVINNDDVIVDNVQLRGTEFTGEVTDLKVTESAGELISLGRRADKEKFFENVVVQNTLFENASVGIFARRAGDLTVSGCVFRNLYKHAVESTTKEYDTRDPEGVTLGNHIVVRDVVVYDCLLLPFMLTSDTRINHHQSTLTFEGDLKVYNWRSLDQINLADVIQTKSSDKIIQAIIKSAGQLITDELNNHPDMAKNVDGKNYYLIVGANAYVKIKSADSETEDYIKDNTTVYLPSDSKYREVQVKASMFTFIGGARCLTLKAEEMDYIGINDTFSAADRDMLPQTEYLR